MFRGKLSACEQDEGHMEDAFDYGDFAMDVLKEDELHTSILFVVRRIIVAPKVEKDELDTSLLLNTVPTY